MNQTCCVQTLWAKFITFSVGSAESGYRLHLTGYDHDSVIIENILRSGNWPSLSSRKPFATYDNDNDKGCAAVNGFGSWYDQCLRYTGTRELKSVQLTLHNLKQSGDRTKK